MSVVENRPLRLLFGVLVSATILVAGCGDDDSTDGSDDGAQSVTSASLAETTSSPDDSLRIATELVDAWTQGWNDDDAEAIASVFDDDGIYVDPYDLTTVSKAQMPGYARPVLAAITNVERLSDLKLTAAETYTWETEYDHRSVAQGWVRERAVIEIELSGDQASRIEFLEYEVIEVLE